jgi:Uma2 family endonuclease
MPSSQAQAAEQPRKMTYEEFLDWCDEDTLAEWVDGDVVMTSPASKPHQTVVDFLLTVLNIYIEQRELGLVLSAPFQMKLSVIPRGREPDLLFIARENLGKLKNTYLDGPADLAVEVVSQESRVRDTEEKLAEYEIGGVREYWIIDPEKKWADFYVLAADGRYERRQPDPQGVYRSEVIAGFWLKEEWLWQDPPPRALAVLRQLGML